VTLMLSSSFVTGFLMCASLIVAIGAQNAFVLRQGLRREHVGAVAAFCALSDLLLVGAGVAGLAQLLRRTPQLAAALTLLGAVFLAWYGLYALWRALRPSALDDHAGQTSLSLPAALMQVAGFTLLNPHVYLDTVLLMGSIGARQPAGQRGWFVGGAALASALWFAGLGYGARWLSPVFARPRAWRILDSVIALIMFVLATRLCRQALQG
jgi:L-lysine exporter family protein LysE/ArgO